MDKKSSYPCLCRGKVKWKKERVVENQLIEAYQSMGKADLEILEDWEKSMTKHWRKWTKQLK